MNLSISHRWDLSPAEAKALQPQLAGRVVAETKFDPSGVRTVAGVDVSIRGGVAHSAAVVLRITDLEPVDFAVGLEVLVARLFLKTFLEIEMRHRVIDTTVENIADRLRVPLVAGILQLVYIIDDLPMLLVDDVDTGIQIPAPGNGHG